MELSRRTILGGALATLAIAPASPVVSQTQVALIPLADTRNILPVRQYYLVKGYDLYGHYVQEPIRI